MYLYIYQYNIYYILLTLMNAYYFLSFNHQSMFFFVSRSLWTELTGVGCQQPLDYQHCPSWMQLSGDRRWEVDFWYAYTWNSGQIWARQTRHSNKSSWANFRLQVTGFRPRVIAPTPFWQVEFLSLRRRRCTTKPTLSLSRSLVPKRKLDAGKAIKDYINYNIL